VIFDRPEERFAFLILEGVHLMLERKLPGLDGAFGRRRLSIRVVDDLASVSMIVR
jgi:hypothetical protein